MGRHKKVQEVISEINEKRDCWWRWQGDEESSQNEIIIYTENLKLKTKIPTMAKYEQMPSKNKKGGLFAVQYKVLENSDDYKELFSLLNLSNKDEKKMPRKKRVSKRDK